MKTWKFRLTYKNTSHNFTGSELRNWDNLEQSLELNETLRGALFSISNVFEFIGKAKNFIQNATDNGGIEANIYLQMFTGNESGHAGSFVKRGKPLKASIKTYSNNGVVAKLTFAISGFQEKFFNRMETVMEYGISEAVDGEILEAPKYQFLRMKDQVIVGGAEILIDETQINILATIGGNEPVLFKYIGVATSVNFSAIQEVRPSYSIEWPPAAAIYHRALQKSKVRIVVKDLQLYFWKQSGTTFNCIRAFFIHKLDANMQVIGPELTVTTYFDSNTATSSTFNINEDLIIDLEAGESIAFRVSVEFIAPNIGNGWSYKFTNNGSIKIISESFYQETTTNCVFPHEAFERIISQITGKTNAFYSTFFGRTDLGYAVDGVGAYCILLNGLLIRSFDTDKAKQTFALKELIDNFIKLYNLVGWFENDIFHLEKYEEAYNLNRVIEVTQHGEVVVNLIESAHVANLKYGYIRQEYEEATGLESFNQQFEMQTHIKTSKNALDLTVGYRTDGVGIELSRRLPYVTNPKYDYRNDKDTFLILCKKGNGSEIVPILGAEYGVVTGVTNPLTTYNVGLSPATILKNWYNVISSGLYLYPENYIKFVSGTKNTNLAINGVEERANIKVSNLNYPLFLPYNLTIKDAILTDEQFEELELYPTSVIKIGDFYGIVKNSTIDLNTNKAELNLTRANR